ncbi:MAG: hypothetical protein LUD47_06795 [Clostridia bacterium]|nr:hypothetical protein [Clostridia bacterium]
MTISFRLSVNAVNNAVKQMDDYVRSFKGKTSKFLDRLAEEGEATAKYACNSAEIAGYIHTEGEGNRRVVTCDHPDVSFLEFGTGVRFNGPAGLSPHPKGKEVGALIGTYGKGHGADPNGWYYFDMDVGAVVHTFGVPYNHFMWDGAVAIRDDMESIAREVFND